MIPYGTRVKYSMEWYGMQSPREDVRQRAEKKRGAVVTNIAGRPISEGCERVQWDDTSGPETIHRRFLEPVNPEEIGLWERS